MVILENLNINLPEVFEDLFKPYRYKAYSSGRGAGKSWSFSTYTLLRALQEDVLILCCREVQNSIADSVHRVLKDQIKRLDLNKYFQINNNSIKSKITNSEFIFKGLFNERSASNVMSLENVGICWIEQGETISQDSIDKLFPTVLRNDTSEVLVSCNARFKEDPIWQMFFSENPPEKSVVKRITWRDNPWFPEALKELMEYDRKISEARYLHIWEGELAIGYGNVIQRDKWHRWNPENPEDYTHKFISADTAFSKNTTADYSVLQLWAFNDQHLDLIDSIRGRWSYPELLNYAKGFYNKHSNSGSGVMCQMVIENKASGQSLIQSLMDEGFETYSYNPGPNNDKLTRVNASLPSIVLGRVRIPPDGHTSWVEPFIAECSSFTDDMSHPFDDQVDAMTQAEAVWRETVN